MSLADFFELAGAVIATVAVILALYVGFIVYKREKKFAPPKRRHRARPEASVAPKSSERRAA